MPRNFLPLAVMALIAGTCNKTHIPEELDFITLPDGFHISIYADSINNARSMCWGDDGTLFVGSRAAGNVYAVRDDNLDFTSDRVLTIASGLNTPNGVAFRDGSLYVAEANRIIRFDNIESLLDNPPQPVVVIDSLPSEGGHWWKILRIGPDNKLYVPVGAPCNICEVDSMHALILRLNLDGTGLEVYARGIRNTVGFDWHPGTGELWFTDNGRDWLGDDRPPDELNRIKRQGQHFGYPYCHGNSIVDPQFGEGKECEDYEPPMMELGPHVAALGMRFNRGSFPAAYRNKVFIAEHGSWNRSMPIGYRIMMVEVNDHYEALSYEPFAEGWLQGRTVYGRPVDLEFMADGSMLVSDDHANRIYRIWYGP